MDFSNIQSANADGENININNVENSSGDDFGFKSFARGKAKRRERGKARKMKLSQMKLNLKEKLARKKANPKEKVSLFSKKTGVQKSAKESMKNEPSYKAQSWGYYLLQTLGIKK